MPLAENAAPEKTSPPAKMPVMSAEGETDMLLEARPIRFSGFLALFLGLLSILALSGQPMMVFPVLAILTAVFALRPHNGRRPLGHGAAVAGLLGATLFAAWGVTERSLRDRYMSETAAVFAADWLRLMAEGDYELACELQNPPASRQTSSMPLNQYYRESAEGKSAMSDFRGNPVVADLIKSGGKVQWQLDRSPNYRSVQSRHLTDTIWRDASGSIESLIKVGLEYLPGENGETAQWTVYSIEVWVDR